VSSAVVRFLRRGRKKGKGGRGSKNQGLFDLEGFRKGTREVPRTSSGKERGDGAQEQFQIVKRRGGEKTSASIDLGA